MSVKLCIVVAFLVCCISAQLEIRANTDSDSEKKPDYKWIQQRLDAKRQKWSLASTGCYTVEVRRSCFCLPAALVPFSLVVVDEEIESIMPTEFSEGIPTIEEAFDKIQEAIDGKAAKIVVNYNKEFGYPEYIYIDSSFLIADEEQGFSFENLVINECPSNGASSCPSDAFASVLTTESVEKSFVNGFNLQDFISAFYRWTVFLQQNSCEYKFKLGRLCFCLREFVGPTIITVKNNKVVSAEFEDEELGEVPQQIFDELPTILDLFSILLEAALKADEIAISYDAVTGIPTDASIDFIKLAIDDEIDYSIELI